MFKYLNTTKIFGIEKFINLDIYYLCKMAKEDFRTIYKTNYSTQGTLQNQVIPFHIDRLMNGIYVFEMREKDGIHMVMSSLSSLMPMFSAVLRHYEELIKDLDECRRLRIEWLIKYHGKQYPQELAEKLYLLYGKFLYAFNDSGAGIQMTKLDANYDRKRYDAIVGNPVTEY
jgi:hypothetical protein